MHEDVSRIFREEPAIPLAFVRELKEEFLISIFPFKEGSAVEIPLRKERAALSGVAGLGLRLDAALFLYVGGEISSSGR